MIAHKEGKRANGVGITGLVLGSAGLLAGITAWIFGGMQAKSQSAAAREAARGAADVANEPQRYARSLHPGYGKHQRQPRPPCKHSRC